MPTAIIDARYILMKNLMVRKHVLSLLVAFVLALGVVGVVDAVTLTARSDRVQSKRVGAEFEITFSVALRSPIPAYTTSGTRRLVNSGTPAVTTLTIPANPEGRDFIDGQGYELNYLADGRGLRVIHATTPGYIPGDGRRVVLTNGASPPYAKQAYVSSTTGDPPVTTYTMGADTLNLPTAAGTISYVDASGYAYTDSGAIVYVQRGTGARDNPGTPSNENDPYTYVRLRAVPQDPLHIYDRFDYNNEQITITSSTAITLVNKKDRQNVVGTSATPATTGTMMETADFAKLEGTVTLVCTPAAGTYTITIADSTPERDYPRDIAPPTRSSIVFTLYVTTETPLTADTVASIKIKDTNTRFQRVSTAEETETVSHRFTFENVDTNARIRYKVIKGNGKLYVGAIDREDTSPVSDLTVHKDAKVFLKTNRTSNTISASVAGSEEIAFSATIEYDYTGSDRLQSGNPQPPVNPVVQPRNPSLTLSQSTISGAANSSASVIATVRDANLNPVSGVQVTFSVNGVAVALPTTNALGQASASIVIPSGGGTLTATSGYGSATAAITVTGTTTATQTTTTATQTTTVREPSRLTTSGSSSLTGEPNRRLDTGLTVRVVDSSGVGVSGEIVSFRVTEGRGRLSPARPRTDSSGYAEAGFTPMSTGTIEVEAVLGNLSPVTFTITTGEPPDAIKKISGDNQSGRPGERLSNPFVVEVVDTNGDQVSGVTVTFAVTAGGGTLSTTSATTNGTGRAQTTLRLGDEVGDNTVTASVTGLRQKVTFTASAGATVLLDATKRPEMYWIDKQKGTLHRLVADGVENLAANVEGVTSIAVDADNGLLYWGVKVGRSGGKIQRSRLNGRNIQTLKDGLTSVPMGIALDSSGGTIYWSSASGKIRSMATEGSARVTKILENLSNPTSLAVSNGYLYWIEPLGRVRRVSLTATRKTAANIATGLGEPLSIAIASGKIYWVERSNGGGGSLQRANLNGTQIEELKAFTGGVPLGISIDASAKKIYWTKLSKIQRTGLTGRSVTDVVTGLARPGVIALGVVAQPVEVRTTQTTQTTRTTQTTTPTTYSKYDINKDGTVNNRDTKAVAAAVGQSGAAITNSRTDVDGSGTVDVTDLILVIANLDDDVAAPAIDVDLKAMDLDFDRVQEQIEVLLASGDRSHAAQRALMYLQHLLASARPDETALLANYPNPFNPETWIPYHLASSTDVSIRIYNSQGILVRTLRVGHQSAGYYTSRSRAAYWDGRNALGERVASGIYFYQLEADAVSPMRKMVILK